MTVKLKETAEEISVIVDGDLDLTHISAFQSAVGNALDSRQGRQMVVDLRHATYIDSAGLEQLLVLNRKLMAQDSRLTVRVKPNSQAHTVLTITGFTAVMDVEPSMDDA